VHSKQPQSAQKKGTAGWWHHQHEGDATESSVGNMPHVPQKQLWFRQAELSQGFDAVYNFSEAPFFPRKKTPSV